MWRQHQSRSVYWTGVVLSGGSVTGQMLSWIAGIQTAESNCWYTGFLILAVFNLRFCGRLTTGRTVAVAGLMAIEFVVVAGYFLVAIGMDVGPNSSEHWLRIGWQCQLLHWLGIVGAWSYQKVRSTPADETGRAIALASLLAFSLCASCFGFQLYSAGEHWRRGIFWVPVFLLPFLLNLLLARKLSRHERWASVCLATTLILCVLRSMILIVGTAEANIYDVTEVRTYRRSIYDWQMWLTGIHYAAVAMGVLTSFFIVDSTERLRKIASGTCWTCMIITMLCFAALAVTETSLTGVPFWFIIWLLPYIGNGYAVRKLQNHKVAAVVGTLTILICVARVFLTLVFTISVIAMDPNSQGGGMIVIFPIFESWILAGQVVVVLCLSAINAHKYETIGE